MAASAHDQQLADVLLIAAWTGLRWSELREARVRDFVLVPMPVLLVSRAAPEGVETKVTKSGKCRRMPVANRVLPLVEDCAVGKGPDDLLFTTTTGHQLHASAVKRTVHWSSVAAGRRIHDLRHTVACLWLAKGVDLNRPGLLGGSGPWKRGWSHAERAGAWEAADAAVQPGG